MIAVGAAAEHREREIDLGRGVFDESCHAQTFIRRRELVAIPAARNAECPAQRPGIAAIAATSEAAQPPSGFFLPALAAVEVSSGRPVASFCLILARSSGSGLRSRACDHWNCASSVRPVFQ